MTISPKLAHPANRTLDSGVLVPSAYAERATATPPQWVDNSRQGSQPQDPRERAMDGAGGYDATNVEGDGYRARRGSQANGSHMGTSESPPPPADCSPQTVNPPNVQDHASMSGTLVNVERGQVSSSSQGPMPGDDSGSFGEGVSSISPSKAHIKILFKRYEDYQETTVLDQARGRFIATQGDDFTIRAEHIPPRCRFMQLKGQIQKIPSELPWEDISSRVTGPDPEDPTFDLAVVPMYDHAAPASHRAIRFAAISAHAMAIFYCCDLLDSIIPTESPQPAVGFLFLITVFLFKMMLALVVAPWVPGRPFFYLRDFHPRNIL